MDMNLSKLWETAEDRGAWWATVRGVTESRARLSGWITIIAIPQMVKHGKRQSLKWWIKILQGGYYFPLFWWQKSWGSNSNSDQWQSQLDVQSLFLFQIIHTTVPHRLISTSCSFHRQWELKGTCECLFLEKCHAGFYSHTCDWESEWQ